MRCLDRPDLISKLRRLLEVEGLRRLHHLFAEVVDDLGNVLFGDRLAVLAERKRQLWRDIRLETRHLSKVANALLDRLGRNSVRFVVFELLLAPPLGLVDSPAFIESVTLSANMMTFPRLVSRRTPDRLNQ